jgi:putative oxidoreductase
MHGFWRFDEPQMKQNQMAHFMKNMSLAGAALTLLALYQQFADRLWMLTGPLFG